MRVKNLDGLRGIAALIVVFHHHLLTIPWFADRVAHQILPSRSSSWRSRLLHILEYSPLHLFFAGTEAVTIFFVLSGYVLVFAVTKPNIHHYLKNRAIRLWAPIVGAVIFSAILLIAVPRTPQLGQSWWLQSHGVKLSMSSLVQNIWVIDGNNSLNSSLWSMRYELIFSMAVLILAGVRIQKRFSLFLLCMFLAFAVTYLGVHANLEILGYLPMFFAGSAIHCLPKRVVHPDLQLVVGVVTLLAPWYFTGFGVGIGVAGQRMFMIAGAVLIVNAARYDSHVLTSLFTFKPIQIAGKYSYSLYLIHAPVLVTIWFALGQPQSISQWITQTLISLVAISLATFLLFHLFEAPSLRRVHRKASIENSPVSRL